MCCRLLRLWRVLRRTWQHYGHNRPDLPDGCPERFSPEFLWWIWSTRHSGRANAAQLYASAPDNKRRIHLTNPRAVARYVSELPSPP